MNNLMHRFVLIHLFSFWICYLHELHKDATKDTAKCKTNAVISDRNSLAKYSKIQYEYHNTGLRKGGFGGMIIIKLL